MKWSGKKMSYGKRLIGCQMNIEVYFIQPLRKKLKIPIHMLL
jgi:hypothetical protein